MVLPACYTISQYLAAHLGLGRPIRLAIRLGKHFVGSFFCVVGSYKARVLYPTLINRSTSSFGILIAPPSLTLSIFRSCIHLSIVRGVFSQSSANCSTVRKSSSTFRSSNCSMSPPFYSRLADQYF